MDALKKKRPIGIGILSWLHMAAGVIGAMLVMVILAKKKETDEALDALAIIGIPPALLLCGLVLLLLLAVLSGIGMWKAKPLNAMSSTRSPGEWAMAT